MSGPRIAFGQQLCGIFPRRYFYAKIKSARRLQKELSGEIIFFCHDSDHDPRETRTIMRHRKTGERAYLNFSFENKIQRKFSPQYLKRVSREWQELTALQLAEYVETKWIEEFQKVHCTTVADFCLEMYRRLGLLEGIKVIRSSDPGIREAACEIPDAFADIPYEGETVRARYSKDALTLHAGGDSYINLPSTTVTKTQISPTRDTRLPWMQSVIRCTHYIAGNGELAYLRQEDSPDITFISRDSIDRSDEAYVPEIE